jgi:predicted nucleic acid-binding protein
LADLMIAATAEEIDAGLATRNLKHFLTFKGFGPVLKLHAPRVPVDGR